MGFKEIIVGIVIIALFSLSLITFGTQLAINNNATNNILNDPSLSQLNKTLSDELKTIKSTSQTEREVFEQQEAQGGSQDEGFSLTSIVAIVKTFFSTAISSFNLIFIVLSDIFGIPALVFDILLGIIIIIILILIWRLIKVGGT